jgi:hypothetical protein
MLEGEQDSLCCVDDDLTVSWIVLMTGSNAGAFTLNVPSAA